MRRWNRVGRKRAILFTTSSSMDIYSVIPIASNLYSSLKFNKWGREKPSFGILNWNNPSPRNNRMVDELTSRLSETSKTPFTHQQCWTIWRKLSSRRVYYTQRVDLAQIDRGEVHANNFLNSNNTEHKVSFSWDKKTRRIEHGMRNTEIWIYREMQIISLVRLENRETKSVHYKAAEKFKTPALSFIELK